MFEFSPERAVVRFRPPSFLIDNFALIEAEDFFSEKRCDWVTMYEKTISMIWNELTKKREKKPGGTLMNLAMNTASVAYAPVTSLSAELLRAVEKNDVTQMR